MELSRAALVLREEDERGYFTFKRSYVLISGSALAGLFLAQAAYLSGLARKNDGWFYHTREQWNNDILLTRYEQESVRAQLRTLGLLKEERRGVPAKLFYCVDFERIADLTADLLVENQPTRGLETNQQAGGKPTNTYKEIEYIENTNTSKNRESRKTVADDMPPDGGERISSARNSPARPARAKVVPEFSKEDRDAMWDAYEQGTGIGVVTKQDGSNYGEVVRETLRAGITPDQVALVCKRYKRRWPDIDITWRGVYKNLGLFLKENTDNDARPAWQRTD